MISCPSCSTAVEKDVVLGDREYPECGTTADDLYRLASGLPTQSERSGMLWGAWSR